MTSEEPLSRFRACVMADETLAASLTAIEDTDRFVASAIGHAAARGMTLSEPVVRQAIRADPLNIARFAPRSADGSRWPPPSWLPVHVSTSGDRAVIDWAYFGPTPLTEPFFEDSIRRTMSHPFGRMFTYRMALDDFMAAAPRHASLTPDGFIFHMSRCGSTLVAQMLAALPDNIVISEAAPVDAIVQLIRTSPHLPAQFHTDLLRAIVAAYGRQRSRRENRYFLKLDCWHALALPLFMRAFPETPWIFLYRDPVEVLVSHMRQRGSQMVPTITPPQLYGIDDYDGPPDADYCARVLGIICEAAAAHLKDGGLAINYRELPEAFASRLLPHFGIRFSGPEMNRMTGVARQDAKAPHFAFAGDCADKQREAKPALRATAESRLAGVYQRLEALKPA